MTEGWFYLSFANADGFLGGCYVRVEGDPELEAQAMIFAANRRGDGTTLDEEELAVALAPMRAYALGINPGGEVRVAGPLPDEYMDEHVPEVDRERLLTREEV